MLSQPLAPEPNAAHGALESSLWGSSRVAKFGGRGAVAVNTTTHPCYQNPKPHSVGWSQVMTLLPHGQIGAGPSLFPCAAGSVPTCAPFPSPMEVDMASIPLPGQGGSGLCPLPHMGLSHTSLPPIWLSWDHATALSSCGAGHSSSPCGPDLGLVQTLFPPSWSGWGWAMPPPTLQGTG